MHGSHRVSGHGVRILTPAFLPKFRAHMPAQLTTNSASISPWAVTTPAALPSLILQLAATGIARLVFIEIHVVQGFSVHKPLLDWAYQQPFLNQGSHQVMPAQGDALMFQRGLDQEVVVVGVEKMWRCAGSGF
jgi:hypothetical protein